MTYEAIGQQIKKRRLELDITARELARRTGLSASFISQLERGKTKVSLESLRLIAEQLDVSIMYFLSDEPADFIPADESTVSTQSETRPREYDPVVRADNRPKLTFPDSGVSYELLTADLSRSMESICGRLAPGTGNIARRLRMSTEELIYVISGSLLVGLKTGDHVLNLGDTIYIDGDELLKLVCASEDEDAVWLSVITPPAF